MVLRQLLKEPKVPEFLKEIQQWFAAVLTKPFKEKGELKLPIYDLSLIREIEKLIAPSPLLRPEQTIGIYNQQYWWRLFAFLQDHYPSLVRLFGYQEFNALIAEPYFLKYPPADWRLHQIGCKLPDWIDQFYREEDLVLILQMARLDEAYERLLHVKRGTSISIELTGDLLSFRTELLKRGVEEWQTADFPSIAWFSEPKIFTLRTPS